jgi:transposase InsO family protein
MRGYGRKGKVERKKASPPVRTAEEPGQTINVDLCFVPATHEPEHKLPAVSGSSGRLVGERLAEETDDRAWPGRVFENENQNYTQTMLDYVAASQAQRDGEESGSEKAKQSEKVSLRAQKRALRQEEDQLRIERRTLRQERKQEDCAWKALKGKRRQEKATQKQSTVAEWKAQDEQWRMLRDQRRATRKRREGEDERWREQRRSLREQLAQLPIVTAWIAILVITDNCTRKCLGVPLFIAGATVTAEMVVEALRALLPAELQFLISDRGTHFTADIFATLAKDEAFIHVVIARHRPQSNGIAERFVRTLKEWLRDKFWQDDRELAELLGGFLTEYNDRPHQGLPIPGLSPNEFEKRIWLM